MSGGNDKGGEQLSESSDELRWRMQLVVKHAAVMGISIDESAAQFNNAMRQLQNGEARVAES